jgi:formyl-CoA transferase
VRLGDEGEGSIGRAPALGEHTDEVLGELGFTSEEIAAFRKEGVV